MRAAWRERYGPPSVVEVRDIDKPEPKAGEILIQVQAASVNRADLDNLYPTWQILRLGLGLRRPRNHRLGSDVAGVVAAVGEGVPGLKPGDRVFGDLYSAGQGAFAEFVSPAAKAVALLSESISFEDAATLPHSAILALQGLRRRNGTTFRAGDKVLIVGASGNVGPFAIQIAKNRGAEVTGVASTEKLDFVRLLGADHVVDYETTDPRSTVDQYDWILDVEAHHSVASWRKTLRPGGVYVALGGSMAWFLATLLVGPLLSLATRKHMGIMLWWKPSNRSDLEKLLELMGAGTIKPVIDKRFPLDQVGEAMRYVDEGRARGKVIVTP